MIKIREFKAWNLLSRKDSVIVKQMFGLSNKNKFTKWGFFKHLIISHFNKGWKTFVAMEKGEVAGFSFTKKRFLYRLVVDAAYRGKGLGKKLIPKFINATETNRKNVVEFYKKMGYRVVAKKKGSFVLKKV